MNKSIFIFAAIVLFCLNGVFSQSGLIATVFGSQGELILDIDDQDKLQGIVKDDVGNIYFYGGVANYQGGVYPFDFFIGKLFQDGQLDQSFGTDGYLRGDFPNHEISIFENACVVDDGVVLIGNAANYNQVDTNTFYAAKVNFDGEIDLTWGNSGFFTDTLLGMFNSPGSVIQDSEGKIVICGSTTDFESTYVEFPFIIRLGSDGIIDSTFGQTGIILFDYYDNELVNAFHLVDHFERHGEGAYLDELIEIDDNYFLAGKFTNTSFDQIHVMSITKNGEFNPNFVAQGLYPIQIDPGSNHQLYDIVKKDSMVYMSLTTTGLLYGGKQVVLPISASGNIYQEIVIECNDYDEYSRFIDFNNDIMIVGGFSEVLGNGLPGHFSDRFVCNAMKSDYTLESTFGENGSFVYQSSIVDIEQGAEDMILLEDIGVLGGYANRVIGDNVTDFMFVAFSLSNELQIEENEFLHLIYPNPTKGVINIPNGAQNVFCFDAGGRPVFFESLNEHTIELKKGVTGIITIQYTVQNESFFNRVVVY